jgi:hypothetical protein
MQKVPYDIWAQYVAFLKAKVKDVSQHENLKKWFLDFWDFRSKYHTPDSRSEQVRLFIEKLQNKGQSHIQQKQAAQAVSLYFQMHDAETKAATTSATSHYPAAGEGSPQKWYRIWHRRRSLPLFRIRNSRALLRKKGLSSHGNHSAVIIVNGDVLRNPDLRRGTRSSPICPTRSRPATIPGKH